MKKQEYVGKIISWDSHRNGIGGAPFTVATFEGCGEDKGKTFVAVLFGGKGRCAVFDLEKLGQGEIRFFHNSWRGDNFEYELRPRLKKLQQERNHWTIEQITEFYRDKESQDAD